MATIDSLGLSITQMSMPQFHELLSTIRAKRRTRPTQRMKDNAKTPARVARAPSKKNPKTTDLFALASSMTQTQKDALAAQLIQEMLK